MPGDTFLSLPSYSSCLFYSAMTLFRTTLEDLSPVAGQACIFILLLLFCSFITLFSVSFVFCKLVAPPHSPPQRTPSHFSPLSLHWLPSLAPLVPLVVLRSLFLASIPPSLQSRTDIGHEVREMGSRAPAVSRLKWA